MTYVNPNNFPSWYSILQPTSNPYRSNPQVWPYIDSNRSSIIVSNKTPLLHESFKPKRAGKNKSHVIFILDDSGSMQSCRESTIAGFNEYLKGQQADKEIETFVSLYKFDGYSVNRFLNRVEVLKASPLNIQTYNPQGGGTNLLDAIGGVLMSINLDLQTVSKLERDSIIITVLTDGAENSSKTFSNENIALMIKKAENKNWGFMFLGANVDAFSVGSTLGFGINNTMQYDATNAAAAISSASAMTSRMKSSYAAGNNTQVVYEAAGFSDQERKESNNV